MLLIDKVVLKRKITNYCKVYKPNPAVMRLFDWLMNIIDRMPVVEERQKGKWIGITTIQVEDKFDNAVCNLCGSDYTVADINDYNYCPYCGSEMVRYKNGIKS